MSAAIGRRLVEVERRFWMAGGRPPFPRDAEGAWFGSRVGNTAIRFEDGLTHVLAPEPEWLSVLVLDRPLGENDGAPFLASSLDAGHAIRGALGRRCLDVRIWRYEDGVPSDEPKECAISYLLEGDLELVYGTYLDGTDDDLLLLRAAGVGAPSDDGAHAITSLGARDA